MPVVRPCRTQERPFSQVTIDSSIRSEFAARPTTTAHPTMCRRARSPSPPSPAPRRSPPPAAPPPGERPGLRRSELVTLAVEDLERRPPGGLLVHLRRSGGPRAARHPPRPSPFALLPRRRPRRLALARPDPLRPPLPPRLPQRSDRAERAVRRHRRRARQERHPPRRARPRALLRAQPPTGLSDQVRHSFEPAPIGSRARRWDFDKTVLHVAVYTDRTGPEEYDRGLPRRRAASVGRYLGSDGVVAEALRIEGRGESEPRASNASTTERARKRRGEIRIEPIADGQQERTLAPSTAI